MKRAKDLAIIVLLGAVVYLLVIRDQIDVDSQHTREPSIAVLPFANLSSDPGKEYLSDQAWDRTITELSTNPNLAIISRSTSTRFKGTYRTVESIGAELGVEYVVEGAVRATSDGTQILAQLIRVADGAHVWHETYEETGSAVDTVPPRIALSVAREVGTIQ